MAKIYNPDDYEDGEIGSFGPKDFEGDVTSSFNPEPSRKRGFGGDLTRDLAKGAIGVTEMAAGVLDYPTGGAASLGLRALGVDPELNRMQLDRGYSAARKAQDETVANSNGLVDSFGTMLANPRAMVGAVAESALPSYLGGKLAKGVGATMGAVRSGLGFGAMEAGSVAYDLNKEGKPFYEAGAKAMAGTSLLAGTGARLGLGGEASLFNKGLRGAGGSSAGTTIARLGLEAGTEGGESALGEYVRDEARGLDPVANTGTAFGRGAAVGLAQAGTFHAVGRGFDMLAGRRSDNTPSNDLVPDATPEADIIRDSDAPPLANTTAAPAPTVQEPKDLRAELAKIVGADRVESVMGEDPNQPAAWYLPQKFVTDMGGDINKTTLQEVFDQLAPTPQQDTAQMGNSNVSVDPIAPPPPGADGQLPVPGAEAPPVDGMAPVAPPPVETPQVQLPKGVKSTPEQISAVIEKFGGEDTFRKMLNGKPNGFRVLGKDVFGREALVKALDTLAQDDAGKQPATIDAERALIFAFKEEGWELDNKLFDSEVKRLLPKDDEPNLTPDLIADRIAARLQEENAKGGLKAKDDVVDKLQAWHKALTGQKVILPEPEVLPAESAVIAQAAAPEATPQKPAKVAKAKIEKTETLAARVEKAETEPVAPKYTSKMIDAMDDDAKVALLDEIETEMMNAPDGKRNAIIVSMKAEGKKAPQINTALKAAGLGELTRGQLNNINNEASKRRTEARDRLGINEVDMLLLESARDKNKSDSGPNSVSGVLGKEALAKGGGMSLGSGANIGARDSADVKALEAGDVDKAVEIAAEREKAIQEKNKAEDEAKKKKVVVVRKAKKEDETKPAEAAKESEAKVEAAAEPKADEPVISRKGKPAKKAIVVPPKVAETNRDKAAKQWNDLAKITNGPLFSDLDVMLQEDVVTLVNKGEALNANKMEQIWDEQVAIDNKLAKDKEADEAQAKLDAEAAREAEIKRLLEEQQQEASDYEMTDYKAPDADEMSNDDGFDLGEDPRLYSKGEAGEGSTVEAITNELESFVGGKLGPRISVVQSVSDLPADIQSSMDSEGNVQGFVTKGRAYLVAGNIASGNVRGVFLHEVGVHLGMENLLTKQQLDTLVSKIRSWAVKNDGSMESRIGQAVMQRIKDAKTPQSQVSQEVVAYFVEEAVNNGMKPSAENYKSEAGRWFRTVWAAFKTAMRRLNLFNAEKLTGQDVVDIAYGAARLEAKGAFHGTAALFRKFNHTYMNSGEGAQAFGWGSYFAQNRGIAEGYRKQDVDRKFAKSKPLSYADGTDVKFGDKFVLTKLNVLSDDGELSPNWKTVLGAALADAKAIIAKGQKAEEAAVSAMKYYEVLKEIKNAKMERWVGNKDRALNAPLKEDFDAAVKKTDAAYAELRAIQTKQSKELIGNKFKAEQTIRELSAILAKGLEGGAPKSVDKKGVTHINDFAIADDEWLDLDLPMSEQTEKVQKALEDSPYISMIRDDDENGRRIYNEIAGQLGSIKKASEYLDSIGIKGNTFLDQPSRRAPELKKELEGLNEDLTRAQRQLDDAIESKATTLWIDAQTKKVKSITATRDAVKARLDVISKAAENPTRNLVVFNDKNILRVASAKGGRKAEIFFSKAATEKQRRAVVDRLPPNLQPAADAVATTFANAFRKGAYTTLTARDLADGAEKFLKMLAPQRVVENNALTEGVRQKLLIELGRVTDRFSTLSPLEQTAAMQFALDTTASGKWGFVPAFDKTVVPDPEMEKKYQRMPKASREMVVSMIAKTEEDRVREAALIAKQIEADAATAIENEKDEGEKTKLVAERDAAIKKIQKRPTSGPYLPVSRFGDHIAFAKSKEYLEEEAKVAKDGDNKKLMEMRKDGKHYVMSMHESAGKAKLAADQYRAQGFTQALSQPAAVQTENMHTASWKMMQNMRSKLNAALENSDADPAEKAARLKMHDTMQQMYIETLEAHSLRTNKLNRENINGAKAEEMMRGFSTRGRNMAHRIASLERGDETLQALADMRSEVSTDFNPETRAKKQEVYNEFMARHMTLMNQVETPWQDKIMRVTGVWRLLTSPAYYLQYATQPVAMFLPALQARHGYTKGWSAMTDAYKSMWAAAEYEGGEYNFDYLKKGKNGEMEHRALQEMIDNGVISIGMTQDFGNDSREGASSLWNKGLDGMTRLTHKSEAFNRLGSGLASFRLEFDANRAKGMAPQAAYDAAIKTAIKDISTTYMDASASNAPRLLMQGGIMKGMPVKMLFQFRRFQIHHLALMGRLIGQIWKGATPQEKWVAFKQLGFMYGHYFAMAGALGIPGASLMMMAVQFIWGDDEVDEEDEDLLRRLIGNDDFSNMVINGVPTITGANVQKSIGAGDITSIFQSGTGASNNARESFNDYAVAALGPWAGLAKDAYVGYDKMRSGDVVGGGVDMLPKGLKNLVKGGMAPFYGAENHKGDVLIPAEQVQIKDAILQAIGANPETFVGAARDRAQVYRVEQSFRKLNEGLKKEYTKAVKKSEDTTEIETRWEDMQRLQEKFGVKPTPLKQLRNAPKKQAEREKNTINGVQFNDRNEGLVQSIAGDDDFQPSGRDDAISHYAITGEWIQW